MSKEELFDHLASGTTTVCHAWQVALADGTVLGFTDHDRDLSFGGVNFRASSGMTARAFQQSTGLATDNSEAMGALSDATVNEEDILAGRFDGAEVLAWLVNWAETGQRVLQFRGSFGEIVRAGGAFQAELRGLSEALNQPQGRVYQRACSAVLGDGACGFDLTQPGLSFEKLVEVVEDRRLFRFEGFAEVEDRWFERGRLRVLSGAAAGAVALVKNDRLHATGRELELWQALGHPIAAGDRVRLEPGCDKQAGTCALKFANITNFRGFPHVPGEDWLASYPVSGGRNDGGSLFK